MKKKYIAPSYEAFDYRLESLMAGSTFSSSGTVVITKGDGSTTTHQTGDGSDFFDASKKRTIFPSPFELWK